jgi:hypothetical protein
MQLINETPEYLTSIEQVTEDEYLLTLFCYEIDFTCIIHVDSIEDLPEIGSGGYLYITDNDGKQFYWNGLEYKSTGGGGGGGGGGTWGTITGNISDQTDLKNLLSDKVDSVAGYSLTKNNLSDLLKSVYDSVVSWINTNGSNILTHIGITSGNPHGTSKSDIGLSNVDNTSDVNKPVSTAQGVAIGLKQDSLGFTPENVSNKATNFTTINDSLYPSVNAVQNQILSIINGLNWKRSVLYSTTTGENLSLSGLTATIDGVSRSLHATDRILVKNQTDKTQNGIYNPASGSWTRTIDSNTASLLLAATVYVYDGVSEINRVYSANVSPIILGSTQITFALIAGVGTYSNGTNITLTGNVFDINITQLRVSLDAIYSLKSNVRMFRGTDTGAADVYIVTVVPTYDNYVDKDLFLISFIHPNATTTPTLAISGQDALVITKKSGSALTVGDIQIGEYLIVYDSSINKFHLMSPSLETTDNLLEGSNNKYTTAVNIANVIAGVAETAILDADEIPFWKSVGTVLKKITWANIKTTLQNTFLPLSGGTITGMLQQIVGQYYYTATSATADTINDIRESVAAGVIIIEKCTVANAAKGGGTWVNIGSIYINIEESSTPVTDDTDVTGLTALFFVPFTLPTTYKFYRITAIEIKNGTSVAGNVKCGAWTLNANPPTVANNFNLACTLVTAVTGANGVQKIPTAKSELIPGGTLLGIYAQFSDSTTHFRVLGGQTSASYEKLIAYSTTFAYEDLSAYTATTYRIYAKVYYQGIN